ncbi:hypothetical protein BASA61_002648 [Batrachochytrium salamandrivorans]|nr:hypothetical protein BASA61_002648 [Batrachochytrium salamandrivorans]KAH9276432.1 hypothetical protein BASA83_001128 [Batrachochytrium salamandrivorans]
MNPIMDRPLLEHIHTLHPLPPQQPPQIHGVQPSPQHQQPLRQSQMLLPHQYHQRQRSQHRLKPPYLQLPIITLDYPDSKNDYDELRGHPDSYKQDDIADSQSFDDAKEVKRKRVTQACDVCNRKKIKCDGKRPICTNCHSSSQECTYVRITRKRGPRAGLIEELEARVLELETTLKNCGEFEALAAIDALEGNDRFREYNDNDEDQINDGHDSEINQSTYRRRSHCGSTEDEYLDQGNYYGTGDDDGDISCSGSTLLLSQKTPSSVAKYDTHDAHDNIRIKVNSNDVYLSPQQHSPSPSPSSGHSPGSKDPPLSSRQHFGGTGSPSHQQDNFLQLPNQPNSGNQYRKGDRYGLRLSVCSSTNRSRSICSIGSTRSSGRSVSPVPPSSTTFGCSPIRSSPFSSYSHSPSLPSPLLQSPSPFSLYTHNGIGPSLIQVYMHHVHPYIPVLHAPTLSSTLQHEIPLLVNAVAAIASRYAYPDSPRAYLPYYTAATDRILDAATLPSSSAVVALLILTHHTLLVDKSIEAWVFLGIAVRIAQQLGFHVMSNPDVDYTTPFVQEQRRRIWHSLYETDLHMSILYKLSPCIRAADATVAQPGPESRWLISSADAQLENSKNLGSWKTSSSARRQEQEQIDMVPVLKSLNIGTADRTPSEMGLTSDDMHDRVMRTESVKLLEIAADIARLDRNASGQPIPIPFNDPALVCRRSTLHTRLCTWKTNAPKWLNEVSPKYGFSSDGNPNSSPPWSAAFTLIIYHYCVIKLHETMLPKDCNSESQSDASAPTFILPEYESANVSPAEPSHYAWVRVCTQSAFTITAIVECFLVQSPNLQPFSHFIYHFIHCAGMTLLKTLRMRCEQHHISNVARSVDAVISALTRLSRFDDAAASAISILRELRHSVLPLL